MLHQTSTYVCVSMVCVCVPRCVCVCVYAHVPTYMYIEINVHTFALLEGPRTYSICLHHVSLHEKATPIMSD